MAEFDATLRAALAKIHAAGCYRYRRRVDGSHGALLNLDGQTLVNFCSNDYLGLAAHPELAAAMAQAATVCGVGSGAAPLVTGYNAEHAALERELAEYVQRPRALLLSTGYQANIGVISSLVGKGDHVFSDRLNHASLIDGCRLSGAKVQPYAHVSVTALVDALRPVCSGRRLIVSDAVFSMDGDQAPLKALANTAAEHDAWLMVDDAHGFGVMGAQGRGSLVDQGLSVDAVPVMTATLGKAIGAFGAFVAGSDALIDYLINAQRTFIFSTAPPPALAAAARVGLRLAGSEEWRRSHLRSLIQHFQAGAKHYGLPVSPSETPIQPLVVGDEAQTLALSSALRQAGFHVAAIRPPTVPVGTSRLRITLSAAHSKAQVTALLTTLAQHWATLSP